MGGVPSGASAGGGSSYAGTLSVASVNEGTEQTSLPSGSTEAKSPSASSAVGPSSTCAPWAANAGKAIPEARPRGGPRRIRALRVPGLPGLRFSRPMISPLSVSRASPRFEPGFSVYFAAKPPWAAVQVTRRCSQDAESVRSARSARMFRGFVSWSRVSRGHRPRRSPWRRS